MELFEGIDEEPPDEEQLSSLTPFGAESSVDEGRRRSQSGEERSSAGSSAQPRRPVWHSRSLSYQSPSQSSSRSPVRVAFPAGGAGANLRRRGSHDKALEAAASQYQYPAMASSPSSNPSFGSPGRLNYLRPRTMSNASMQRASPPSGYSMLSQSPTSSSFGPGTGYRIPMPPASTSPTTSGTPPFGIQSSLARRMSLERRNSMVGEPNPPSPNSLQAALQSLDEEGDRFPSFTSPRAGASALPAISDPPVDADEPWINLPPPALSPTSGLSAISLNKPTTATPTQEDWRFSDSDSATLIFNSPRMRATASPVPPSLQNGGSGRRGSFSSGLTQPVIDPLVPISPPSDPESHIASTSQAPPSPSPSPAFSIPGFSAIRGSSSHAGESNSSSHKKPEDLTLMTQPLSAIPSHSETRGRSSPSSPHRPGTSAGRRPSSKDSRPSSFHGSPASAPSLTTSFHIPPSISRSRSPLPSPLETPYYQLTRQRSHSPSRTSSSTLLGSPGQRASSTFHRRSPSVGSHAETFLSFLPHSQSPISPRQSPKSPKVSPKASPKASPRASPRTSPKGSPRVSPNASPRLLPSASKDHHRPGTLTLETMSAFRFGSSPTTLTGSRTPSPQRSPNLGPAVQGGPTMFPQIPHSDLSLPPPSGWNLSDDADLSPLEETDLDGNERYNPFDEGVHLSRMGPEEAMEGSNETPPSPVLGSIPLPLEGDQWGAPLDFNRSQTMVEHAGSHFEDDEEAEMTTAAEHGTPEDMDEENLTALERIFLFAKSEHVDHRETVSRMLPTWLEQVEICEAVEYILPLFAALAQDEETVREALAERLADCMWYFFSRCPLLELSAQHQIARLVSDSGSDSSLEQQLKLATEQGIQTRIIISEQGLELIPTPPSSMTGQDVAHEREESMLHARQAFEPGPSKKLTPGTGSTLVSIRTGSEGSTAASEFGPGELKVEENTDMVDRPSIPVGTFHEALGLLLMGESGTVSNIVQEAIVHFLLRLQEDQQVFSTEVMTDPEFAAEHPENEDEARRQHEHATYKFTKGAKAFIRDDLLSNVVVALAKLDSAEKPDLVHEIKHAQSEQEQEDAQAAAEAQCREENQKFSSFFEDTHMSVSPANPEVPSASGLDAEEGRYICLCLISLIAEMEAVPATALQETLLPIVCDLAQDEGAGMRRQCVEALAAMAKALSSDVFTTVVLPTIEVLVNDTAYIVRKLVASSLPDIARKIAPESRQANFSVATARQYSEDASDAVRQGLQEIMGPLIYVFAGSVPDQLVDIFIGKPSAEAKDAAKASPAKFTPLIPSFALPATPVPADMTQTQEGQLSWDPSKDSERAIISAYNVPGVILSLGAEGWPRLRSLHHQLATKSSVSRPRLLIASSIHDVAKIIGPSAAEADLLPLLQQLGRDEDPEVGMRAYERFPEFVQHLADSALSEAGQILSDCWFNTPSRDWRMREVLAESLAAIAEKVESVPGLQSIVVQLLEKVLQDTISSVRTWGTKTVPLVLRTSEQGLQPYQQTCLRNLLNLAKHVHHKFRAVFTACLLESVSAGLALHDDLERALLDLVRDRVTDVRIGVARVLFRLCSHDGRYGQIRPQPIADALQSLTHDPERVVSELLQSVDLHERQPIESHIDPQDQTDSHSVDSSDDEDDHSPVSSSSTSARRLQNAQLAHQQSEGSQSSSGDPSDSGTTGDSVQDEDDADSIDLDDSAISDSDLEDLAFSSVYIPTATISPSISHPSSVLPTRSSSYVSFDSLLSKESTFSASGSSTPTSSSSCKVKTGRRTSWRFSMRDEEQYVAIDLMG